jgi:hypothetical protein
VNDRWAENPRLTMLVNSLSSRMRHFAMFEWFYSTIDRDYFNHNEFQDCLDHLELRHITKLTRSAQRSAHSPHTSRRPPCLHGSRTHDVTIRKLTHDVTIRKSS